MALTPRPHGITQTESPIGRVSIDVPATSVWGIVATAPAAVTANTFAKDVAILVTDVAAMATQAEEVAGANGTLAVALRAIADHGRSVGVVVIVDEVAGAGQEAKTLAGILKLAAAEQAVGVRPRIIATPGLETSPVITQLGVNAIKLNGFTYAKATGATPADLQTFRNGFGVRELMLLDGDFKFGAVTSFSAARAVGLRAKIDREIGYHKSISNVEVLGVDGVTVSRSWNLFSADTDMGLVNGADVTGIIRRGGYRFWGNRTCSADPRFSFEVAVRTNQFLKDAIGEGLFPYIDQPLRPSLILDIIESLNAMGRREVRLGRLIGFEAFLADTNTPDQLAAGKLRIGYRFTPVAPLEDLQINSEITDEFYADLAVSS